MKQFIEDQLSPIRKMVFILQFIFLGFALLGILSVNSFVVYSGFILADCSAVMAIISTIIISRKGI